MPGKLFQVSNRLSPGNQLNGFAKQYRSLTMSRRNVRGCPEAKTLARLYRQFRPFLSSLDYHGFGPRRLNIPAAVPLFQRAVTNENDRTAVRHRVKFFLYRLWASFIILLQHTQKQYDFLQ